MSTPHPSNAEPTKPPPGSIHPPPQPSEQPLGPTQRAAQPTKPPPVGTTLSTTAQNAPTEPPCASSSRAGFDEDDTLPNPAATASPLTRRRFVQGALLAGAAGAGAFIFGNPTKQTPASDSNGGSGQVPEQSGLAGQGLNAAPVDQRILVLIELEGGNDGLSTAIPLNDGLYYDLRPQQAFPEEELLAFDETLGLNPNLVQLAKQRLTLVEGVGPINGDLSHFEMVRRWEQGDMAGAGNVDSGFLARLVDGLGSDSAMAGLSVAGHTPRFTAAASSVLSVDGPHQLSVLTNDDWIYPTYRNALKAFGGGSMAAEMNKSWNELFSIGDALDDEFEQFDEQDPMIAEGGELGRQLKTAAALIRSDVGVRVIHARLGGFDTHEGHAYKHAELMRQVDVSVAGFLNELELAGLADRVLVATSSEFGRRVQENGGGFDHGSASTMLMSGPITTGRLGEPSPLDNLDEDGNLKTTLAFDRYLATLAQSWLGVEAASILPNTPQPFDLFSR